MKKDYKQLYKEVLKEYDTLYKTIDATKLKPASGSLRNYQLKTLDFCENILKILDKLNLKYFPIGGTLIGAIRHKGFVPWDDDFDIGMMRDEYETFYDFCKNNYVEIPPEEISFSSDNRSGIWDKYLRKNPNKIIYSRTPHHIQLIKGENIDNCVNMDIFPHDKYKEDLTIEEFKTYIDFINKKKYMIDNYKKILDFFKKEKETNPIFDMNSNKIYYGLDNIDNYILPHRDFFNEDMIFPLKKAKFENIEIWIQNNPIEYAERQYKHCLKMPSDIIISSHLYYRSEHFKLDTNKIIKLKLYKFLLLLIYRKKDSTNSLCKNLAIEEIKRLLTRKTSKDEYKDLYEKIKKKLEFFKSIT